MLKIKSRPLSCLLTNSMIAKYSLKAKTLKILTSQQTKQNFTNIIAQKILLEQENKQNLAKYKKYFNKAGWTINNKQAQIQLSKIDKGYQVYLLSNIKILQQKNIKKNSRLRQKILSSEVFKLDIKNVETLTKGQFAEMSVFIKPISGSKWLVVDLIVNRYTSDMVGIRFTEDILREEKILISRTQQKVPTTQINMFQPKVKEALQMLIQQFGLKHVFLAQAAQFASASQQKLYIQWLKNLRSLI